MVSARGGGMDTQVTKEAMNRARLDPQLANDNSPAAPRRPPGVMAARLTAIGGILGAIAASSCCIAPLLLFSLGISGAWIANLTALAPYQPYFIAATFACLIYGYWLAYRRKTAVCAEDAACSRPLPNRIVLTGLVLATVLVAGAIGADLIGPYLNP